MTGKGLMQPMWHRIFDTMPVGREVTSRDIHGAMSRQGILPRGVGLADVAQGLRRMAERGEIEDCGFKAMIKIYRRDTKRSTK